MKFKASCFCTVYVDRLSDTKVSTWHYTGKECKREHRLPVSVGTMEEAKDLMDKEGFSEC